MTVYATYALEWTPDITAGLSSAWVDITSDAIEISWRRGRDYASQLVGKFVSLQAMVTLDNSDGAYSSFVTINMRPGRRVRLQATDGTGTVTLWTGFVQRVTAIPSLGSQNVAEMLVTGPLGYIGDRQVDVSVLTSVETGAAVHEVLTRSGWPDDYADQVLSSTPVGYWRLGEASGNAIDASGNGNDGTVTGATYAAAGLLGGDADTAYSFDGASGDVTVPAESAINDLFADGGSIEAWIAADSDGEGSEGRIFDKRQATGAGWYLATAGETGGAMKLLFGHTFTTNENARWQSTDTVITVGATHHIALTYDGSSTANSPILYVDGLAVAMPVVSAPTGTIEADAALDLSIANRAADDLTFDGTIDEVAVYTTVLTPADVRAHYAAGAEQWRAIDDGQTTMTRWWSDPQLALNALREIEDTELGFIWETRDGKMAFDDRNARLDVTHQTSQATFSDALAAALPYFDISQEDSLPFVFNDAEFPVQLYTDQASAVLWTMAEIGANSPLILAAESATYWAVFPSLASASDAQGVTTWTTTTATTDFLANAQSDGGGANLTANFTVAVEKFATKMKITLTNAGVTDAYITFLQARGVAFTADDPVLIRVQDEDSIELYGSHPYPLTPKFIPDTAEAISLANLIVSATSTPIALPRITCLANRDAAMLSEALRRDISDRITIVADSTRTRLGLAHDVFIESEEHAIDRHRTHTFSYQTSAASTFSDFWVWGFAKFDTTTKWAG